MGGGGFNSQAVSEVIFKVSSPRSRGSIASSTVQELSEELALAVKPGRWQRESSAKNVPGPKLQRLRRSGQGIEAWCGSVGIQQWSHGC